jgi:hypothetical protein
MNTQTKNEFLPIEKDFLANKYMTKDFLYRATLIGVSVLLLAGYIYHAGYNAGILEATEKVVSIYAGVQ